jgi:16S rRNA (guanine527-N7)-methyltransferase
LAEQVSDQLAVEERIAREISAAGLCVSEAEKALLARYFRLLEHWNEKINLTAFSLTAASSTAISRLLVEPLLAARYVPSGEISWIDVGSGGGSPAIPMRIVRGMSRLTMVEARSRKAAFLAEAVRALELPGVSVLESRLEESLGSLVPADLITIRAVRTSQVLARALATILSSAGQLFVFGHQDFGPLKHAGFSISDQHMIGGSRLSIFKLRAI